MKHGETNKTIIVASVRIYGIIKNLEKISAANLNYLSGVSITSIEKFKLHYLSEIK